jgi:hypothetical protein
MFMLRGQGFCNSLVPFHRLFTTGSLPCDFRPVPHFMSEAAAAATAGLLLTTVGGDDFKRPALELALHPILAPALLRKLRAGLAATATSDADAEGLKGPFKEPAAVLAAARQLAQRQLKQQRGAAAAAAAAAARPVHASPTPWPRLIDSQAAEIDSQAADAAVATATAQRAESLAAWAQLADAALAASNQPAFSRSAREFKEEVLLLAL